MSTSPPVARRRVSPMTRLARIGSAEDTGGQLSDLLALIGLRARPGQGRAGTDALQRRRPDGAAQPAHQHGDVGALPAPVGVQFVEHEKRQVRWRW